MKWPMPRVLEIPLGLPRQARPLRMIYVDAGEGILGLPESEPTFDPEERQVQSRITRGYWLGETPVTVAQWRAVTGGVWPLSESTAAALDLPAGDLDWDAARAFCHALPEAGPLDAVFELPTEQQWEHACRGGTTSRYYFGDDDAALGAHAHFGHDAPRPVAAAPPNAWGFYDMLGNISEWCLDSPGDYPDPAVDHWGTGLDATASLRCTRGGTYRTGVADGQLLCGRRGWMEASARRPFQGLRVALIRLPMPSEM